jgi:hypothetical protein
MNRGSFVIYAALRLGTRGRELGTVDGKVLFRLRFFQETSRVCDEDFMVAAMCYRMARVPQVLSEADVEVAEYNEHAFVNWFVVMSEILGAIEKRVVILERSAGVVHVCQLDVDRGRRHGLALDRRKRWAIHEWIRLRYQFSNIVGLLG